MAAPPWDELPEHFHFLSVACRAAQEELPEFQALRSLFGFSHGFQDAARCLLSKAVAQGDLSTGKSGSLMAFEGPLVAKSMTRWEAKTLQAILGAYLSHVQLPENRFGGSRSAAPGSLLPRFLGAYAYARPGLAGLVDTHSYFVIMAGVFADVPQEALQRLERFDLKGSADGRTQRKDSAEFMDFDLLRRDRKLVPQRLAEGEDLLEQLARDVEFLLQQRPPMGLAMGPDFDALPEAFRGRPGLMDYSLLVGLAPRGTSGGLRRLDVCDMRVAERPLDALAEGGSGPSRSGGHWRVEAQERTAFVGIIDVLQFWTPKKRMARGLKKALGLERDEDGEYHGEILDTLEPEPYMERFLHFVRETFTEGSWVTSLPRLSGGDWADVLVRQIRCLPGPQQEEAMAKRQYAIERHRLADGGGSLWRRSGTRRRRSSSRCGSSRARSATPFLVQRDSAHTSCLPCGAAMMPRRARRRPSSPWAFAARPLRAWGWKRSGGPCS